MITIPTTSYVPRTVLGTSRVFATDHPNNLHYNDEKSRITELRGLLKSEQRVQSPGSPACRAFIPSLSPLHHCPVENLVESVNGKIVFECKINALESSHGLTYG
jgi:hypothetical protein